ncbi:MAG: histidine kinase [Lachnospiraceae bacterium]|nr:histidine kinase [Lachnospiraceae bacterium]
MTAVLHTLCVMCSVISVIYCFVVFNVSSNTRKFLLFTGSYVFFTLHLLSDYAISPYMLFRTENPGISAGFYLASYALVSMFMSFFCSVNLRLSNSHIYKYIRAFGYVCMVASAVFVATPAAFVPWAFVIDTVLSLPPSILACILSFKIAAMDSKVFLLTSYCHILMVTASILDLCFAVAGFSVPGLRCISIGLFCIAGGIILAKKYTESIVNTDSLSSSLTNTLEKIKHSDNALMCTRMNPDFLYKSLSLIRRKCDEDTFMAEELTVSLSKYLRHTLNFQQLQGIVPISNEIELTKAFIAIERARNPHITFELRLPDEMPEFHIPPLSIQPLVENAIEHGFLDTDRPGRITVTILNYQDYFHIDVSDTGEGMDEETLAKVTEFAGEEGKVGLFNIHARLVGLFGKGLVIQSAKGIGTSVSFMVPPDSSSLKKEVTL